MTMEYIFKWLGFHCQMLVFGGVAIRLFEHSTMNACGIMLLLSNMNL